MSELTAEEKLQQELEQEQKEHDHHHPTAAAMTNHIVANLAVLWTKLHQYHWYVKGPQFFHLHEKFAELYTDAANWYDKIAETLLAMDAKPFSTTGQNMKYTFIQEDEADKYRTAEEMVANMIDDFRLTRDVAIRAIYLASEQGHAALENVLIDYKRYLDKQIWLLQAFLGKTALEDEEE
ncbi:Dps family protein [Heyndrickxia acidiproducens]|uniref:Dps family protein n=1 Tax=Heyndrickxia acidiproducens TaxID=1121084 RepID=UPI00037D9ED2|nr:DNA starvation/stationary phase protection protein [Heyndrickxia acidiproducens]